MKMMDKVTAILVLILTETLNAHRKKTRWLERGWQAINFHSFTYCVLLFSPRGKL
jgi:hypothetical protein